MFIILTAGDKTSASCEKPTMDPDYAKLKASVLNLGRDLGVHDIEGQRILQVTIFVLLGDFLSLSHSQVSWMFYLSLDESPPISRNQKDCMSGVRLEN